MQALVSNSTVASRVINLLREEIIAGRLAEGAPITIKEIADKYSVSPMPVREAFRVLEGERLLEIQPYKGAVIRKIDETFFLSVLDICDALEAYVAEAAMFKIGEFEIEQLASINEQIAAIKDTPRDLGKHLDLNTAFHAAIFAWAENEIAQSLHSYYHSLARMVRGRYRHSYSRIQEVVGEHYDIIQAFRSKDPYVLKRAVDNHAKKAKESLLQQFKREQ